MIINSYYIFLSPISMVGGGLRGTDCARGRAGSVPDEMHLNHTRMGLITGALSSVARFKKLLDLMGRNAGEIITYFLALVHAICCLGLI